MLTKLLAFEHAKLKPTTEEFADMILGVRNQVPRAMEERLEQWQNCRGLLELAQMLESMQEHIEGAEVGAARNAEDLRSKTKKLENERVALNRRIGQLEESLRAAVDKHDFVAVQAIFTEKNAASSQLETCQALLSGDEFERKTAIASELAKLRKETEACIQSVAEKLREAAVAVTQCAADSIRQLRAIEASSRGEAEKNVVGQDIGALVLEIQMNALSRDGQINGAQCDGWEILHIESDNGIAAGVDILMPSSDVVGDSPTEKVNLLDDEVALFTSFEELNAPAAAEVASPAWQDSALSSFPGDCTCDHFLDESKVVVCSRRSRKPKMIALLPSVDLFDQKNSLFSEAPRNEEYAMEVDVAEPVENQQRRQRDKLKRISMGLATTDMRVSLLPSRKAHFVSTLEPPTERLPLCTPAKLKEKVMRLVFPFLAEKELLSKASLVCTVWFGAAAHTHAKMLECSARTKQEGDNEGKSKAELAFSMEKSWADLNTRFPWGCFLAEGGFKRVFKVYNTVLQAEEAISVMDFDAIVDKRIVGVELGVSALLSSLPRRGVCPNFILMRGVFSCRYEPAKVRWGSEKNKRPQGNRFINSKPLRLPREPTQSHRGRYQYIRMELCRHGDVEEFIKLQSKKVLDPQTAQSILFQTSFALHAGADRFSLKHYDLKLLNIFLQNIDVGTPTAVIRYGLGSQTFALRMPAAKAMVAKLADFGTANVDSESNGQPVTVGQFSTLENTPPDYLILGDDAVQGHGHDAFGLGLIMLHLFSGFGPYEEILKEVKCPSVLRENLRRLWEEDSAAQYSVVRSVVFADTYQDETGITIDGESDDTLYDTLYRFFVLFGIPDKFSETKHAKMWEAILDALVGTEAKSGAGRPVRNKAVISIAQFDRDCQKFSIKTGFHPYIARARAQLRSMDGGMDLLFQLCAFDPDRRATPLQVISSTFMQNLREVPGSIYSDDETVVSYMAFLDATRSRVW